MLMNFQRLDRYEFDRAIRRGLGSAFLHISAYGDAGIEEELLGACLHNYVFDKQIDGSRHDWLAMMIDRSGRWQFYADAIVRELESLPDDPWDFEQLVWLGVEMYERGHAEVREVLMRIFESACEKYDGCTEIERAITSVAGLPGFEMGARWLGRRADGNEYECHSLYKLACDLFYGCNVDQLLETEPRDLHLRAFRNAVKRLENIEKSHSGPDAPPTLAEVLEAVSSAADFKPYRRIRRFGKTGTEAERRQIYEALLKESNSFKQYAYLEVFELTGLPDVSEKVFEFLKSEHERLRHRTLCVLEKMKSPAVRKLALEFLQSQGDSDVTIGLRLLRANCEAGDSAMIFEKLAALTDLDHIHRASMAIRDASESIPQEPWERVLLRLYDIEPCGFCRRGILEKLIARKAASRELLVEARWDASQEVRMVARGATV
jgi:hypothetical protein